MTFKNKMKKFGNQMISQYAKNPYKPINEVKNTKVPLWLKISLPTSVAAVALVVTLVTINALGPRQTIMEVYALNNPNKIYNTTKQPLDEKYVKSVNQFASDYYNVMNNIYNHSLQYVNNIAFNGTAINFVFSPISILNNVYAMYDACSGVAKEQFGTIGYIDDNVFDHQKEVKKMIDNVSIDYMDEEEGEEFYSNVSNALIVRDVYKNDIKESYIDLLTNNYYADLFISPSTPGAAHKFAYDYIDNHTNNFLYQNSNNEQVESNKKDALLLNDQSPIDTPSYDYVDDIRLINTYYIKSSWGVSFVDIVKPLPFTNYDNSVSDINYIGCEMVSDIYIGNGYKMVSIPLLQNYSFNVLLPDSNNSNEILTNGFDYLSRKASNNHYLANITIKIPTFDCFFDSNVFFDELLKLHNYPMPFSIASGELNNITTSKDLEIDYTCFINVTDIKIDANGILGTTLTVNSHVIPATSEGTMPHITLDINRPFMYSITNGDNLPTFVGKVNKL